MRYAVEIANPAAADIDEQVDFLFNEGAPPERVLEGVARIDEAMASLAEMPERCPRIPEPLPTTLPVHHLLMSSHRIVFAIDRSRMWVVVYRVFHGARRMETIG